MWRLLDLLVRRGNLDGVVEVLRARADVGDDHATSRLVDVLAKQGQVEDADRLRRFGLNPDGAIAST